MPHTVRVPATPPPQFPTACIVCGAEEPDSSFTIRGQGNSLPNRLLSFWLAGLATLSCELPCCRRGCRNRLLQRRLGPVVGFPIWAVGVGALTLGLAPWLLGYELDSAPILIAFWGLLFLPIIVFEFLLPPHAVLEAHGNGLELHFRDRRYAEAFAAANGTEVLD